MHERRWHVFLPEQKPFSMMSVLLRQCIFPLPSTGFCLFPVFHVS